jgi:anaerobic selenocysteine-containing dehydrogenase
MPVSTGRTVRGVCHHDCPDSCGWIVETRQEAGIERATRLRGDPAHPFSKGELCPKVNRFLERVHHPDRLLTPLRRIGPKGEGRFEPISWEVALTEIATRISAAVERSGGAAILPFVSAGNQSLLAAGFGNRLWNALGASTMSGGLCGSVAAAGAIATNGTSRGLNPDELVHSRLIILWATNTRLTNRHLWPVIEQARSHGAKVVVIDPLRTITADAGDWFVQPRPGTDIALMFAMMHELIRRDLIDHDWIERHTTGFAELETHVAGWTPNRASEVTGVAAPDIERLAELYGTIRPAAIRTLVGGEAHAQGAMFFRTVACLPALVGAWGDRGGGHCRSTASWTSSLIDFDALERPDLARRERRVIPMAHIGRALSDPTLDPPLQVLVVVNGNPMVSLPATEHLRRGLLRNDLFTVVHEQFLTDTARYADIVLPASTQIESIDVVQPWGHLHLGWNNQAIKPLGEAVSNPELHRRLASALRLSHPALHEPDLDVIAAALPTVDLHAMRRDGYVTAPYPSDGRPFGDGNFPTATGRVQLCIDDNITPDATGIPQFVSGQIDSEFPFLLLTPKRHIGFLNTSYAHLPNHQPTNSPVVEIHPDDATMLRVERGVIVRVHNTNGSLRVPVEVTDRTVPGVVAIPWGWWSGSADQSVVNTLTSDNLTDWGGGASFADTRVAITIDPDQRNDRLSMRPHHPPTDTLEERIQDDPTSR